MQKYNVLFLIVFPILLLPIFSNGCDNSTVLSFGKEEKYLQSPPDGVTIESLEFHAREDARQGVVHIIQDEQSLRSMQNGLANKSIDIGQRIILLKGLPQHPVSYALRFSDHYVIEDGGSLHFTNGVIYATFDFPEDSGFQGSPSICIRISDYLSDDDKLRIQELWE